MADKKTTKKPARKTTVKKADKLGVKTVNGVEYLVGGSKKEAEAARKEQAQYAKDVKAGKIKRPKYTVN